VDLYAVMSEVDTRLKTITGLHVSMGHTGKISAIPAAVQYPPERVNYDTTYRRGGDDMDDLLVVVFVGRSTNRQALKDITPYLAGSGAKSIKTVLDATDVAPYASCSDLTVQWAEVDWEAKVAGAEYAAAIFYCKITGAGA
jgi:hypothetical protein